MKRSWSPINPSARHQRTSAVPRRGIALPVSLRRFDRDGRVRVEGWRIGSRLVIRRPLPTSSTWRGWRAGSHRSLEGWTRRRKRTRRVERRVVSGWSMIGWIRSRAGKGIAVSSPPALVLCCLICEKNLVGRPMPALCSRHTMPCSAIVRSMIIMKPNQMESRRDDTPCLPLALPRVCPVAAIERSILITLLLLLVVLLSLPCRHHINKRLGR